MNEYPEDAKKYWPIVQDVIKAFDMKKKWHFMNYCDCCNDYDDHCFKFQLGHSRFSLLICCQDRDISLSEIVSLHNNRYHCCTLLKEFDIDTFVKQVFKETDDTRILQHFYHIYYRPESEKFNSLKNEFEQN